MQSSIGMASFDIDRVLEELLQPEAARSESAPRTGDPTVIVDPSLWLEQHRPIQCRPLRLKIARGTLPPPPQHAAVYCVLPPPPDHDIDDDAPDDDGPITVPVPILIEEC